MCGIFCVLQYGSDGIDTEQLVSCLSTLNNRGPDSQSYRIVDLNIENGTDLKIFLGFTRLAIMDTSDAGMQPFTDNNGNYVVCNGEIYNHTQLAETYNLQRTNCDCGILLPLYNKIGIVNSITTELDAEYAMVLYSKTESKLYAVRDKYGVRPLYYGFNNKTKTVGFASELKALHTIMEHVYQVKPNYLYSIDLTKYNQDVFSLINTFQYYNYDNLVANINLDDVEYIKFQINDILTNCVRKRLRSDRPIGFLLSGGLDSSLIVAIASRIIGPDKMVCFTIGVAGSPDVVAAIKVAEYLKIKNHHVIDFDIETGINTIPEIIKVVETYDVTTVRASTPQYIMAKYINENTDIRVLLSGEGSDEIHGSYRYFRDAPNIVEFHQESINLLEQLYYFDNKRVDRTMSGNGLEVRIPFLDTEYVEFITRINPKLLMYKTGQIEKQILRDSFVGYLPDDILYRSKEAFSDAVSSNNLNWANSIKTHASKCIIDNPDDYERNHTVNTPLTDDAVYFRNIFCKIYPGRDTVIPYYWLPKFQKTVVVDPSATVLDCY